MRDEARGPTGKSLEEMVAVHSRLRTGGTRREVVRLAGCAVGSDRRPVHPEREEAPFPPFPGKNRNPDERI